MSNTLTSLIARPNHKMMTVYTGTPSMRDSPDIVFVFQTHPRNSESQGHGIPKSAVIALADSASAICTREDGRYRVAEMKST